MDDEDWVWVTVWVAVTVVMVAVLLVLVEVVEEVELVALELVEVVVEVLVEVLVEVVVLVLVVVAAGCTVRVAFPELIPLLASPGYRTFIVTLPTVLPITIIEHVPVDLGPAAHHDRLVGG